MLTVIFKKRVNWKVRPLVSFSMDCWTTCAVILPFTLTIASLWIHQAPVSPGAQQLLFLVDEFVIFPPHFESDYSCITTRSCPIPLQFSSMAKKLCCNNSLDKWPVRGMLAACSVNIRTPGSFH